MKTTIIFVLCLNKILVSSISLSIDVFYLYDTFIYSAIDLKHKHLVEYIQTYICSMFIQISMRMSAYTPSSVHFTHLLTYPNRYLVCLFVNTTRGNLCRIVKCKCVCVRVDVNKYEWCVFYYGVKFKIGWLFWTLWWCGHMHMHIHINTGRTEKEQ